MLTRRALLVRATAVFGAAIVASKLEPILESLTQAEVETIGANLTTYTSVSTNAYTNVTSGLAALKEFYRGPVLDALYKDNPFLAMVKKDA